MKKSYMNHIIEDSPDYIVNWLESWTKHELDYIQRRDEIQWNYGFDSGRIFEDHKKHDSVCDCAKRQNNLFQKMDKDLMRLAKSH